MTEFEKDLDKVLDSARFHTENEQIFFRNKKEEFVKKYELKQLPVIQKFVADFIDGDENKMSKSDRIAYLVKSVEGDSYYLEEELPKEKVISQEDGIKLANWAEEQTHEFILNLWNGFDIEEPRIEDKKYCVKFKKEFTKTELSKVMGGAFYKQTLSEDILTPDHVYYGSGKEIVEEWINELIELVPVDEEV